MKVSLLLISGCLSVLLLEAQVQHFAFSLQKGLTLENQEANYSAVPTTATVPILTSDKLGSLSPKIIKLLRNIDAPVDGEFYVTSVSDEREFVQNIGIAHRRLDKLAVIPLILHSEFLQDVKNAVQQWRPNREGAKPVKMVIQEIYLWDYFHYREEVRYAKVKVEFLEADNTSLGVFTARISEKGDYKRFSHEKRLEKALWECMQKFARSLRQSRRKNTELPTEMAMEVMPRFGAFINFLDFKNRDFQAARPALYRMDGPGLFRYKVKKSAERRLAHYAYMEKGELYIKATNYANSGDYFVKVLERGRYLFLIDRLNIQALSKYHFDEIDQTLPSTLLGIVIDTETGIPYFVTDSFLQELLAPYPDLAKKYLIIEILNNPFQLERVRRLIREINQRY